MPPTAAPDPADVRALLARVHGEDVGAIEALAGGFWSSAYAYRTGGRDLVLRLGGVREGFEADRKAMAYRSDRLPVPTVVEVGDALGMSYAISERHWGRFLESVRPDEAPQSGPMLAELLTALFLAPPDPTPTGSWRTFLLGGLVDDPQRRVHGWRVRLAEDRELDRLFDAVAKRVATLVVDCPERRDLVHGDLLHGNVLVSQDASSVQAVFSWKCAQRGDFLYDVAWCTFWGFWYPGIAPLGIYERVLARREIPAGARTDVALRHHCYELQIGATHLGWMTWVDDLEARQRVAAELERVLGRGPLS